MLDRAVRLKENPVATTCFRRLQKPETGRDFNDKWILIKRVPEEIVRALRLRARYALTMNLIRSFVRKPISSPRSLLREGFDLSGNLSG